MTSDATFSDGFVVVRDPAAPPRGLAGCVVAIGNFDGVHRGHAAVIGRAQAMARRLGKPCVALTFSPHPADYFAGRSVVFRLTPGEAKARALARLGLDGMVVMTFDDRLAALSAQDFVDDILLRRLGVSGVVIGYDFHFGRKRAGSPDFLREAGARHGFEVEVVERIEADAAGSLHAVHSGAARRFLEAGDVAAARALFGHDWFVIGEVVHGQKLGRQLGFPTANIRLDPSCRLRYGIYAVRMTVDGVRHDGVASWGKRPTVDDGPPLLEVYLFDFSGDLYGKTVEVAFVAWLRGEEKFDSLEALIAQIERDAANAKAILRR